MKHRILQLTARITVLMLGILLLALLCYFIAVVAGGIIRTGEREQAGDITIFFIDNDYHVEICLPAGYSPFRSDITRARGDAGPPGGYYCFGWGDRTFYPETPFLEDLNFRLVTRALFLPTAGAVRISFYRGPISGPVVTPFTVTRKQLDALYTYIDEFLLRDADGAFIVVPPERVNEVYGDSLFLHARGTYSLFHTCNNWTAQALKQAGIRTGIWTPLAWGVLSLKGR